MLTTAGVGSTDDETLRDAATASTGALLSNAARVGHWKNFATADLGPLLPNADAAWMTLTEPRAVKILTPILKFGDGPYLSITRARQR